MVGRDEELDRAVALVIDQTVRLVTITGRSGVGKTVLAHEVLRTVVAETPLAVATVVADHGDGPASTAHVVAALDGAAEGGSPLPGAAPDGRRRVVLIDGFDDLHAVEGSAAALPLVSRALDQHPDLTVLATSTAPLGLRGEHLVRLAPLGVPPTRASDLRAIAAAPAVQLLSERIAAHDPTFELDGESMAPVATICRALDGLPLALELVAPTCATLGIATVGELFAGETPLGLVSVGPLDAADRHRDLGATVAWSYSMLSAPQQHVLRALSTFADTFTLSAALGLVDGPNPATAVAAVEHLVAVGLVDRTPHAADGTVRYRLAATIRSFAREEAARSGEGPTLRDRHAAHFRGLAREAAAALAENGDHRRHDQALADLEEHLVAFDAIAQAGPAADAVRYGTDLAPVWIDAGMAAAGVDLLGAPLRAFEPQGEAEARLAVDAWAWTSTLAVMSGRSSPAAVRSQLHHLQAAADVDELRGRADVRQVVFEMQLQALIYLGELDGAEQIAEEALLEVELDASPSSARVLSLAAVVANQTGRNETAIERATRARTLAIELGDERQAFRSTMVLSGIPGASDVPSPEALLATARRVGDRTLEGPSAIMVALDRAMAGDVAGATDVLAEALDLGQRHGYWHVEELAVLALAVIAGGSGRFDDVAQLHGGVRRHLPTLRRFLAPSQLAIYDGVVEAVRAAAGAEPFDRGVAAGELLGWNEVLAFAWSVIDELRLPADEPDGHDDRDHEPPLATGALATLTRRERAVLELLAQGLTNKAIATELGLRPKTVMHHTSSIYRKLGVATRTEAAGILLRAAPAG